MGLLAVIGPSRNRKIGPCARKARSFSNDWLSRQYLSTSSSNNGRSTVGVTGSSLDIWILILTEIVRLPLPIELLSTELLHNRMPRKAWGALRSGLPPEGYSRNLNHSGQMLSSTIPSRFLGRQTVALVLMISNKQTSKYGSPDLPAAVSGIHSPTSRGFEARSVP